MPDSARPMGPGQSLVREPQRRALLDALHEAIALADNLGLGVAAAQISAAIDAVNQAEVSLDR